MVELQLGEEEEVDVLVEEEEEVIVEEEAVDVDDPEAWAVEQSRSPGITSKLCIERAAPSVLICLQHLERRRHHCFEAESKVSLVSSGRRSVKTSYDNVQFDVNVHDR